eukprot:CAMPEP_0194268176 /NCGR_PEP_ID=MMETSP0169-20130528/2553_1 /TAXON_ID=218684 /ORGANISM="Corethron pennatum, Strain L29A3" /LENGTH=240 /DNA_ID=CAMNT_0039009309 /DNA_START=845 /DNA_END=1567 /DNA_ORIENTATION=+
MASELSALSSGQTYIDDDNDGEFSGNESENSITNEEISRSGPVAILNGSIGVVDDRVVYSGEWHMKNPNIAPTAALIKSKFKYKLKRGFDFKDPSPNQISVDGVFFVKSNDAESGKIKVKEREVMLKFSSTDQKNTYKVIGRGENEYGKFTLVGKYTIKDERENMMKIEKRYNKAISEINSDDELSNVGEPDPDELDTLKEEAELSVEELRKRYNEDASSHEQNDSKRQKFVDEDDELEF